MPLKFIRSTLTAWCLFTALTSATAFAAVDVQVRPGFNVVGVSAPVQAQYVSAFPLLDAWKLSGITAIESYDHASSVMVRAELVAGVPSGTDFPLAENSALFVHSSSGAVVSLGDVAECSALSLKTGFNLVSSFCPPAGYRAADLINSLGLSSILSIAKFDGPSARWITAAVNGAAVVGEDFAIVPGDGFIIYASADVANWISPRQTFTFSPSALTVHQEEAGVSLTLTIPAIASAGGITVNLVSSNTSTLTVPALVTIPAGTTSVSVPVTALATGSPVSRVVQVTASKANWTSGTASVTVLPKPTVNLTPTTTLTGKGWTYFLTTSLTETAPAGGVIVTLTTSTANVVNCPATVTISEGTLSSQVTVTAVNPGIATITASAPLLLSGSMHTVTVNPVQTINIGPFLGAPVGVMVGSLSSQTTASMSYTPVVSVPVGVSVGSVITGLSPDRGAIGTTDLLLRINGIGLASVNTVTFRPSDGITVQNGTIAPAGDGTSVDVQIAIADTATISQRTIIVSAPSGTIKPASPGANSFRVTYKPPEILSLIPISKTTGSTFTLQINGKNLQQASEIAFIPPDGISVGNPPTVSTDGTLASVNVSIAANATTGFRAVAITTPGGTTPSALTAANTFEVMSSIPPVGSAYAVYNPIISSSVGVLVQTLASTGTQSVPYTPVVSLPVGVAVGATISSVTPPRSAIGTTGLTVRVNGAGLVSATSMTFQPGTGITIQGGTFTTAADGSYAEAVIDIDPAAPLTARTVILVGIAARPAAPGVNKFTVTLPTPEILSIQPIRREVGSTFTMTVYGKKLNLAGSIDFSPATGISVNTPSISTDGTLAIATVVIAANAPTGDRVVTVTTPGGTTSANPTAANTFTVTALPGINYDPLVSQQVGVLVTQPSATMSQVVSYGPIETVPVGVMVTTAPSPTTASRSYTPVVSLTVGVTVGPVITGISPASIEPGTSQDITIYGIGLDSITAVQILPSTGFTVGTPVPAGDGLSSTVTITADPAVTVGTKTIIVSSASGTLRPSTADANILRVGPAPTISSLMIGAGNAVAAAGSTVTLTVNGAHLQGATEVRFIPSSGIEVNNPPMYYTDVQGEHLSVTVVIAFGATGGDRVVTVTTPYGTTTSVASPANMFTVAAQQTRLHVPGVFDSGAVLVSRTSPVPQGPRSPGDDLDPREVGTMSGMSSRTGDEKQTGVKARDIDLARDNDGMLAGGRVAAPRQKRIEYGLFRGYRGPPLFVMV